MKYGQKKLNIDRKMDGWMDRQIYPPKNDQTDKKSRRRKRWMDGQTNNYTIKQMIKQIKRVEDERETETIVKKKQRLRMRERRRETEERKADRQTDTEQLF